MAKITFNDKSYINENADIPEVNKITDANINEIKSVVNSNYDEHTDAVALISNCIMAQPSTSKTLSTTNYEKISLETATTIGTKLTLDNVNKCVSVGAGVSKVMISGNILFSTGGTSSTRRGLSIYKNGTQIMYNSIKGDTTYTGCSIAPYIIDVQENDTLELWAINQGATGSIITPSGTWLTVRVVE